MLIEQIKADLDAARKEHNQETLSLLTTLYSDIQMVGKNALRESTDIDASSVVKKFVKGIDETLSLLTNSDAHTALRIKLNREKFILDKYSPKQLTEYELNVIISQYKEDGFSTMPLIMKELKLQYTGQYDGALASKLVKESLS